MIRTNYLFARLAVALLIGAALLLGWAPSSPVEYGALIVLVTAPFPYSPEYTAIAVAYRNESLIADMVLPYVPVGSKLFRYLKYKLAEGFTIPDTRVGRKSAPNEVEFSATETEASCEDYGLDDPVPQDDIDTAPPGHDPLGSAVEGVTDLVLLDREKRVADLVFDAAQYAAANKVTLAGANQWSDFAGSNPISDILTGLDAMVMRGNVMVIGRQAWTKLIQHPKIVKATYGDATDAGVARKRDIAELFELEEILVGQAWVNTAKKGQAVAMSRVWGKHAALIHRNKTANARRGTTFGFTARFGSRVGGTMPDQKIGLKGGQRARAGESVKEVITANDLGYFIQNAVA